jgi:hypothetical protein
VAFEERGAGALPKLYGAPAYARRVVPAVVPVERPFDPDDLPLECVRLDEDDATDIAEASTTSSAWADIVAVMASSSADSPYAAHVGGETPAAPHPAEPMVPADPTVTARRGGLFKGRRRGAS